LDLRWGVSYVSVAGEGDGGRHTQDITAPMLTVVWCSSWVWKV
jgi:hypothetical protein